MKNFNIQLETSFEFSTHLKLSKIFQEEVFQQRIFRLTDHWWTQIDKAAGNTGPCNAKTSHIVPGGDTGSRPLITCIYSRRSKKAYPVSLWLDSGLPTGPDV